jgi:Spy/CpxP family protein refolding chaperone
MEMDPMNRMNVTLMMAALVLGVLPPVALSQMRGGPGGEGFEEMHGMHMLLRAANLTPDQKNQVHDMMKANRTQNKAVFKQIRALREQIADKLAGSGQVSESELNALQSQITQLRGQLAQQTIKSALQVRALLTPDQLTKVATLHTQMKALHEQERQLLPEPEEERPENAIPVR